MQSRIILNELEEIEKVINSKSVNENELGNTIYLLTRYLYHEKGLRRVGIISYINNFMATACPNYHEWDWFNRIEKYALKAKNSPLMQIDSVPITQQELNCIEEIKDLKLEKLAFTMLALSKFCNMTYPGNSNWIKYEYKFIFELANITCTDKDRLMALRSLMLKHIITRSKKNGVMKFTVNIVDNESDAILNLSDFRNLGYEYLLYKGQNYTRCKRCGQLFKQSRNNRAEYCKSCRGYQKQETKTIVCQDCGKEFTVDAKANHRDRCDECLKIERKRINHENYLKRKNSD